MSTRHKWQLREFMAAVVLAVGCLFTMNTTAFSEDVGLLGPMKVSELSVPDTAVIIKDPTGKAPTENVYSFSIVSDFCQSRKYDNFDGSDCKNHSVRSQMHETLVDKSRPEVTQPKQAWYGWYMYFPKDFAYGKKQPNGGYTFFYWHGSPCPHVTIDNFDHQWLTLHVNDVIFDRKNHQKFQCVVRTSIYIQKISSMLGKWNRFEASIKWSKESDGNIQLYMNGKKVANYDGPNVIPFQNSRNSVQFGLYLHQAKDMATIAPTGMYFAAVKSAKDREGLKPN